MGEHKDGNSTAVLFPSSYSTADLIQPWLYFPKSPSVIFANTGKRKAQGHAAEEFFSRFIVGHISLDVWENFPTAQLPPMRHTGIKRMSTLLTFVSPRLAGGGSFARHAPGRCVFTAAGKGGRVGQK